MKVSVVVPVYNTEGWLEQCVESLIHQTVPFYEIILVDDGSLDNSLKICKKFADSYANVIVVEKKHSGPGATRNAGIDRCSGQYLMFVDSDDKIDVDTLKIIMPTLEKTIVDVLYFDGEVFGDDTEEGSTFSYIRNWDYDEGKNISGREMFDKAVPGNYFASACTAMYRTEYLKKNGLFFPEWVFFEDNVFTFKTMMEAGKVTWVGHQFYLRRLRKGSTMLSAYTREKLFDYSQIINMLLQYISDRKIDITKKVINFLNMHCNNLLGKYKELLDKDVYLSEKDEKEIVADPILRMFSLLKENSDQFHSTILNPLYAELIALNLTEPIKMEEKVIVYGIGKVMRNLETKGVLDCLNIIAFCDSNMKEKGKFLTVSDKKIPVISPEEIQNYSFDYILIATYKYYQEIYETLVGSGIDSKKIERLS